MQFQNKCVYWCTEQKTRPEHKPDSNGISHTLAGLNWKAQDQKTKTKTSTEGENPRITRSIFCKTKEKNKRERQPLPA